jgi:hypothetical protein
MAVRPAFEGRWRAALHGFDATGEVNALDVPTRGDTVDGLAGLVADHDVDLVDWYGVRLFVEAWPVDHEVPGDVDDILAVEVEASRRDPYSSSAACSTSSAGAQPDDTHSCQAVPGVEPPRASTGVTVMREGARHNHANRHAHGWRQHRT